MGTTPYLYVHNAEEDPAENPDVCGNHVLRERLRRPKIPRGQNRLHTSYPPPTPATPPLRNSTASGGQSTAKAEEGNAVRLLRGGADDVVQRIGVQAAAEIGAVVEDLEVNVVVVHDHGSLDRRGCGTAKVVAVATGNVAVQGALHAGVAGSKDLEKVKFTTSRLPAGAVLLSVLESARNQGVKNPDGWHIHWLILRVGRLARVGHHELEEESLR